MKSALFVPALLLAAACSSGSDAAIDPFADAPAVTAIAFPAEPGGMVQLELTVAHPLGEPTDVVLEVAFDGTSWRPATLAEGEDPTDLPTRPEGRPSTLVWDSVTDLGFRDTGTALLRATPVAGTEIGPRFVVAVPPLDNLRPAAARVQAHLIHYGPIDPATALLAKSHPLVVVHPFSGALQPSTIREIQLGLDPRDPADDVIVLAYLSVGEDLRTVGLTDQEMLLDARFVGDASGPRIDPRGPGAGGQSLIGLDPLGLPTNAPVGTRYASWYLDDNSVDNSPTNEGDGLPDRNSNFGGCFVNAGDPAWFDVLDQMTMDGADGLPGMQELLTDSAGRGFGCDGLFLDTFDTCAPNSYTNATSPNQSEFEWTAPGFTQFCARLRQAYPDKLVLQNRGMFFFDPRLPHYQVTTRPYVDLVLLESYRLDSNPTQGFDPYFFADNKHNFAPKLLAEAARPDGFRALSLGYAEGPGIDHGTLLGTSTAGEQTLLEDIDEAQHQAGFAHYLTDAGVALANRFVLDRVQPDTQPPVWTSTWNDNVQPFPTPPGAPTPRVGIQAAVGGDATLTVYWDVALDQSRVGYALYLQEQPFDFATDPTLSAAQRVVLVPEVGQGYERGVGPNAYPFEATVDGLVNGTTYHLCLRAFDALGHEEQNQVVLTARPFPLAPIVIDGSFDDWPPLPPTLSDPDDVPPSAGPDWRDIWLRNDAAHLFVRFQSADPFNLSGAPAYTFSRTLVFFDLDEDPTTGWPVGGLGSEVVLAGDELFGQSSASFNTGSLGTIQIAPVTNVTDCELAIPWSAFDQVVPGATMLRVLFVNDDALDFAPDSGWLPYFAIR